MFLSDVTSGGAFPMLEKTLAFTEARNRMLAENIANITTPGYRAKQLDVASFQSALRAASDKRSERGGSFELGATREFDTNELGHLEVTPSERPVENLLFHDGTNARIELQMSDLAENTMMHQAATELLKGYYDGVGKAIRGRL
ncbi:MAG: flagellar basal body rod protein FlgB [Phycisphaerales bacterium]|nr:flagellar basal body rod protein FlgB [Phycisphaerales bacterium]